MKNNVTALYYDGEINALVDFNNKTMCSKMGFPPPNSKGSWSKNGHGWNMFLENTFKK